MTTGRVNALMVFKSIRDPMVIDALSWAFRLSAPWIVLDHPAYIPRPAIAPLNSRSCPETARTVQGMARVRSGQAAAWPLVSDRSVRRGSGVKRDFACTFIRRFSPVLVALRSQSRLMLEGRARTPRGPSPDLSPARTHALAARRPGRTGRPKSSSEQRVASLILSPQAATMRRYIWTTF